MWNPSPTAPVTPTAAKTRRTGLAVACCGDAATKIAAAAPSSATDGADEHQPVLEHAAIMLEPAVEGDAQAQDRRAGAERLGGTLARIGGRTPGALEQPTCAGSRAKDHRGNPQQWPARWLGSLARWVSGGLDYAGHDAAHRRHNYIKPATCSRDKRAGDGRGDRIRTCDPLLPKQMRYQTAPLPAFA